MSIIFKCLSANGFKRSVKTTSRLFVGVFLRALDTAEKGQVILQCRNYRGEFMTLSEYEERSRTATVFCAVMVCVAVMVFLSLHYGVL